jgi:hypothetical protein
MSRHDPVLDDDRLLDALIAGDVPDEPLLAGLAAWRDDVLAAEAPVRGEEPASSPAVAGDHAVPHTPRGGRRRHRAGRAGTRTRRTVVIGVGLGILLSMGVSQAVAGSPVAPIRYVVSRAVDFGEDVGSPTARESQGGATVEPPTTAAEVHTGRAAATAEPSTEADSPETSVPPSESDDRGRASDPGDDAPVTPPPPRSTTPTPTPPRTTPPPTTPTPPEQTEPSDPGNNNGRDRGRAQDDEDDDEASHGHGRHGSSDSRAGDETRPPWWKLIERSTVSDLP